MKLSLIFLLIASINCTHITAQSTSTTKSTPDSSQTILKPATIVEVMPTFPGGEKALLEFLSKNVIYLHAMKEKGIEGIVVAQFIVNTDGTISDIKILRDIGGGAGDEVMRVIKLMPTWTPGINNGVLMPVTLNLPVTFKLYKGYGKNKHRKKSERSK